MFISEAAQEAGVNVQTLRYYERRGLLARPQRRDSGYREFDTSAVQVVRFIKRAQELGFSLDEIEQLIKLRTSAARERPRVRSIAERKVADIDRKIEQLHAMRQALATLVDCCRNGQTAECPIIEALNHE